MSVPISKFDHVCVAVWSIAEACKLFVDTLGGEFIGGGDNPDLGVRAVQLRFGQGIKIELLEPLDPSSFLQRYLEEHGEGLHHLTAYVSDVEATAKGLAAAGYEVVDTDTSEETWKETFLRPTSAFGTLIQLAAVSDPWDEPLPGITLEDVLAGKVRIKANVVISKS